MILKVRSKSGKIYEYPRYDQVECDKCKTFTTSQTGFCFECQKVECGICGKKYSPNVRGSKDCCGDCRSRIRRRQRTIVVEGVR